MDSKYYTTGTRLGEMYYLQEKPSFDQAEPHGYTDDENGEGSISSRSPVNWPQVTSEVVIREGNLIICVAIIYKFKSFAV